MSPVIGPARWPHRLWIVTRQIAADLRPALPAVGRLPEVLRRGVEDVRDPPAKRSAADSTASARRARSTARLRTCAGRDSLRAARRSCDCSRVRKVPLLPTAKMTSMSFGSGAIVPFSDPPAPYMAGAPPRPPPPPPRGRRAAAARLAATGARLRRAICARPVRRCRWRCRRCCRPAARRRGGRECAWSWPTW